MTAYYPYTAYSNQRQYQYYNPYTYPSHHASPYGMTTDGSFRNHYYAVDGKPNGSSSGRTGIRFVFGLLRFGINIAGALLGNGDVLGLYGN